MPAYLVVVRDVDPDALASIDTEVIEGAVDKAIASVGASGVVSSIEVPHVELMAGHAACQVVSESSPAGHSPPLTSMSRKLGAAGEQVKGEVGL